MCQVWIQEVQTLLQHTVPKTIALKVDVAPDLAPVWTDKTLIHQVLMNLCVNAQQAMPTGGYSVHCCSQYPGESTR